MKKRIDNRQFNPVININVNTAAADPQAIAQNIDAVLRQQIRDAARDFDSLVRV